MGKNMRTKELDSSKIKILICCHKKCELPEDEIFLPIHVGASISDIDLEMQRDDQLNGAPCDNISAKNKSYCELTALYWAWKNIKKLYPDLEYIGVNHYRRYFNFSKKHCIRDVYHFVESECKDYELNYSNLLKILKKGRTVIARRKFYPYSLKTDYSVCHCSDDMRTLDKIIQDLYPDYKYAFDNVLGQNNALAHYNMTVIRWADFSNYCEWLFTILSEAEKRINITNYSDVQKRIFGYMSERLFNVWLFKNNIKTVEYPINWYTDKEMPGLIDLLSTRSRNKRAFKTSLPIKIRIKQFLYRSIFFRKLKAKIKPNSTEL